MYQQNQKPHILIASIVPSHFTQKQAFESIKELIHLVETLGGEVIDIVLQNREIHTKGMYLGKGKTEEVKQIIATKNIDIVVLNSIIVPSQIYEFYTYFSVSNPKIQVWDRVDLILKIFSKHAFTAEAKLQIELASMRHMGPRIFGMGMEMSQQGGGIGTRGIGETNTERMKRHWKKEIKKTKDQLEKLSQTRQNQIDRRREMGLKTVSIVGYTNAGKTSFFNILTNNKKLTQDSLFVTLESSTGKLFLPSLQKEILISDTIGFIRDLPPQLIEAFSSTLMESINADLLLHVIDIADEDMDDKINVVKQTLKNLRLENKKIIYVFNKTDKRTAANQQEIQKKYAFYHPQFISVYKNQGVDKLIEAIGQEI